MTAAIFTVQGLLLTAALWRRPTWLCLLLAAAWIAAVLITTIWPDLEHPRVTLPLDLAVTVGASWIGRHRGCCMANVVASISALKVIFTVFAVALSIHPHARAATINAALIAQCIVAGGMADGIIAGLGRGFWRLRRRHHRTLGYVGK